MVAALTATGATVSTFSMPNVVRCGRNPKRMAEVSGLAMPGPDEPRACRLALAPPLILGKRSRDPGPVA